MIRTLKNSPPASSAIVKNGKIIKITGYAPKIIETISKYLNFTIKYDVYHQGESLTGEKLAPDFKVAKASFRTLQIRKNRIALTFPFNEIDVIFIISRFAPYTPFQKNFLPFEAAVWYWLIATLAFVAAVIFVISFAPEKVYKFVFGSKIHTPLMNMM